MLFYVAVVHSFLLGYKIPDLFIYFPVGGLLRYFQFGASTAAAARNGWVSGAHH